MSGCLLDPEPPSCIQSETTKQIVIPGQKLVVYLIGASERSFLAPSSTAVHFEVLWSSWYHQDQVATSEKMWFPAWMFKFRTSQVLPSFTIQKCRSRYSFLEWLDYNFFLYPFKSRKNEWADKERKLSPELKASPSYLLHQLHIMHWNRLSSMLLWEKFFVNLQQACLHLMLYLVCQNKNI
jgi:hypothetical protein